MWLGHCQKAVDDEHVGVFIRRMLEKEVLPSLPLPEEELLIYTQSVWDRFCNPFVKHQLLDIALNGVSKFRARILPSLLDYIELKTVAYEAYVLTEQFDLFLSSPCRSNKG